MEKQAIERRLQELSPEIPWAHLIELAPGLPSVTPDNEKFYKKAYGLNIVGELLIDIAEMQVRGHSLQGKRVLDLACGEGGHCVQFARRGADVLGIEGRSLYVERARLAAEATGTADRVKIIQGDVRKLDVASSSFDVVMFSGILHHLGQDDFDGIVAELGRVTDDLLLIYTHISSDVSVKNHKLKGPVQTAAGRRGHLFREHADDADAATREKKVRASLDNTFSFWAEEESLVRALREAGFKLVLKAMSPHPFNWDGASYRPVLVARKS